MEFLNMYLGVIFSLAIIGMWGYIGVLTFALYSTTIDNHHQMRMFYTISVLNIMQAVLGIYYIITKDTSWQEARWVAFSLIEIAYLSFVIGTFKRRWIELVIRTLFYVVILISWVVYSLWINILICAILATLAYCNKERIIRKHFTWIFSLYAMTSIVPVVFGFTGVGSLWAGVVYTFAFAYGAKRLYDAEKVKDAIAEQIKLEIERELEDKG